MKQCLALALVLMLTASCVIQPTGGTRAPLPTPTAETGQIPEDWVEYTTLDGSASFWHPPSWEPLTEEPDAASFTTSSARFGFSVAHDGWCHGEDRANGMTELDCLAGSAQRAFGGETDPDVRVTRQEERRIGGRDGYVVDLEYPDESGRGHAQMLSVTARPGVAVSVLGLAHDEQELECLALVAASASLVAGTGDQPAKADFRVTDWSWHADGSGTRLIVDGVIENTSERPIRYVRVHIATYDSDYKLLSTDSGYADLDYLAPGRSTTFKVTTPVLGGVAWVRIVSLQGQWAD